MFRAEPASLSAGAVSPSILCQRNEGASPSHFTTVRPSRTVAISNGRVVRHSPAQARREEGPKGFDTRLLLRSMPILCVRVYSWKRGGRIFRSESSIWRQRATCWERILESLGPKDGDTSARDRVGRGLRKGSFDRSRVVLARGSGFSRVGPPSTRGRSVVVGCCRVGRFD